MSPRRALLLTFASLGLLLGGLGLVFGWLAGVCEECK